MISSSFLELYECNLEQIACLLKEQIQIKPIVETVWILRQGYGALHRIPRPCVKAF